MLGSLARFVTGNRLFIFIMVAALVLIGVNAAINLPIEAFPDVQDVQVQIIAQQSGLAPQEIERSVTLPIERALAGTPGVTSQRSVSMTGLSATTLIFADGTDDYFARSQVLEKLRDADLPDGVVPSLGPLSTAVGEIYRYVLDSPPGTPIFETRSLQDFVVRPAIRQAQGVADVTTFGGAPKQFQIRVRPDELRRFGVTLADLAGAVGNANINVGGGLLTRGDESVVIRGVGLAQTTDDLANALIRADQGRTVRVGDVADVAVGMPERSGVVANNRQNDTIEGVVLMIKKQNAAEVVARVRDAVAKVNAQFAIDAKREGRAPFVIRPTYQRTNLIDRTVETVGENLAVGALLVTAILMVFLRNWRASLAVAAIIPLALLTAFTLLNLVEVPANLISMGAVDFGIIIDSAVVLVEALMVALATSAAVTRLARMGVLRRTVAELAQPILFSKAIIITALIPIFSFQRVEGKMFEPVALTLSFALGAALVLTLTFLPAVLATLVHRPDMSEKHLPWMDTLRDRYRRALRWGAGRDKLVFGTAVGGVLLAALAVPLLGSEFLPRLDEGNMWVTMQLAPSASIDTTRRIERQVRAIFLSYPEVRMVNSEMGRPDDGSDPKLPSAFQTLVDLKPRSEWRAKFPNKAALEDDMRARVSRIPGLQSNFSQVIEDSVEESLSGVKGQVSVKVFGPDLAVLQNLGDRIAATIQRVPGAADVAAVQVGGQAEVDIVLNRPALARLGLNTGDANQAIATALAGQAEGLIFEGDRRYDVIVRLAPEYRASVDAIAGLQLPLPGGAVVNLGDVADVQVRMGASRISREGGGRNVSVKANVTGRDQGGFVTDAQAAVARAVTLPAGYSMVWGGQFENQQRAMKRLEIIVPLSLLGIFGLLFWAFRSVRLSALILAQVPLTLIGGVTALALAGQHLSVSAAVGFIAVAGIAVQNGVVMIEHVLNRFRDGDDADTAVLEGAVDRLRPILMTALMAGLGLLPAALSTGIGSETQRPFACVIVGGIVSATAFMLLLLPLALRRMRDTAIPAAGNPKPDPDAEPKPA